MNVCMHISSSLALPKFMRHNNIQLIFLENYDILTVKKENYHNYTTIYLLFIYSFNLMHLFQLRFNSSKVLNKQNVTNLVLCEMNV